MLHRFIIKFEAEELSPGTTAALGMAVQIQT